MNYTSGAVRPPDLFKSRAGGIIGPVDLKENRIKTKNRLYKYIDTGGKKPVVLFLHGLTTTKRSGSKLFEKLNTQFRCIALDLPGHNKLSLSKIDTFNDILKYVEDFIKLIKINNFYIIGYSLGSLISARLAERRQDVRGVVLWASPISGLDNGIRTWSKAVYPFGKKIPQDLFFTVLKNRYINAMIAGLVQRGISNMPDLSCWSDPRSMPNYLRIVDMIYEENFNINLSIPTLFIFDKFDPVISMKNYDYVRGFLSERKNINIEIINLSGHIRTKQATDKITKTTYEFLNKIEYDG